MGKKPAKFALEGNKWAIVCGSCLSLPDSFRLPWLQEYQENVTALTVDNAEISHVVNLFGCKNSTIIIKGKINAVTIGAYLNQVYGESQGNDPLRYSKLHKNVGACRVRDLIGFRDQLAFIRTPNHWLRTNSPA
jgi:Adenylate cyclase associated (CAP) C terminal